MDTPAARAPAATTPPPLDVLTVGEPLVLFAARSGGPLELADSFGKLAAGAELNVATGLARLGLRCALVARVGDDSFGRFLRATIAGEGIDTRCLQVDPQHPTAFMLKTRADDGSDPGIEYFRRGSAGSRLGPADAPAGPFPARHLHLTGIVPALSVSARELVVELARRARDAGSTISFDPNLRPRLWPSPEAMVAGIRAIAGLADLVLPGLAEGRLLTGRHDAGPIADACLEAGARQVVIKLGPEGAYFADRDGARGHVPGRPVARVVDTVGAGDGFAVGVVSGLLEGLDLAGAAARGNAIGARVVQFPGDSDGLPTRAQLESD